MKSTYLRIGNKLQKDNGEIYTVLRLDNTNDVLVEEQRGLLTLGYNLFGIPLTEEWLLELGFEGDNQPYKKHDFEFYIDDDGRVTIYFKGFLLSECYYAHQLQNLYFSLTGEELIYQKI